MKKKKWVNPELKEIEIKGQWYGLTCDKETEGGPCHCEVKSTRCEAVEVNALCYT